MLVDKSDLGFGKRSWRYSMLVKDGVVQKMFIEPEKEGDPLKCRTPTPCWRTSPPRPGSPTRWSCRAARSAWKPGAAAGQGFRSDRDPAGEQGPRPRHRRRLGQGHRAAGVHQRLADRRPGRPEGALRLTGIRHAGPGRPGMPRGSAPCVVEPARRIPRCARSCAAPSGRRGDGRVPSPRSKANSPWARHRTTTPYREHMDMKTLHTDVAVIGAGTAGLALIAPPAPASAPC